MPPLRGVLLRCPRGFDYSGVKAYSTGIYCRNSCRSREGGWLVGGGLMVGKFRFGRVGGALMGSSGS